MERGNIMLKSGFSLVESMVAIFLIALVFMIIASALSGVLTSISSVQNMLRMTELQNFIARWVYIQPVSSDMKDEINGAFYGTTNTSNYPRVTNVNLQTISTYFDKFTFEIEYLPGKTEVFFVYKYKTY